MIAIITPAYMAWDKLKECCQHIDKHTDRDFIHIVVTDSCDYPSEWDVDSSAFRGPKRVFLKYDDGLPADKHRANITKALQMGWDFLISNGYQPDHLFVVESDVMVPAHWDGLLIGCAALLPDDWLTLDVMPVDSETGLKNYPAEKHNVYRTFEVHNGLTFETLIYGDWNAILFSPRLLDGLLMHLWKFDEVPSHHDILLSRKFRELVGLGREDDPKNGHKATFFRTPDVKAVHYPSSSRSMLPEGLLTPSN